MLFIKHSFLEWTHSTEWVLANYPTQQTIGQQGKQRDNYTHFTGWEMKGARPCSKPAHGELKIEGKPPNRTLASHCVQFPCFQMSSWERTDCLLSREKQPTFTGDYSSQQTPRGDRAVPLVPIPDSQIWRSTGFWKRNGMFTLERKREGGWGKFGIFNSVT